jgi:hypothetical protein
MPFPVKFVKWFSPDSMVSANAENHSMAEMAQAGEPMSAKNLVSWPSDFADPRE